MSERRFLVEAIDPKKGSASIRGEELHHLVRVLRLRPGDDVAVFDGRGSGFTGRLESIDPSAATVRLLEPEDPGVEPRVRVVLYQGIPHGDRMDGIVEKGTEIGVNRIVPVVSERSVVRPRSGRWGKLDRWRRIAVSAAKQSGRLLVPEVAEPIDFEEALRSPQVRRFVFHPSGGPAPALPRDRAAPAEETLILVGPEGGWTEEEYHLSLATGWNAVSLGPRILRADTAAMVALAFVLLRPSLSLTSRE